MIGAFLHHMTILPILVPMTCGALLLFYDERRRQLKSSLSLTSVGLLVLISLFLVARSIEISPHVEVYSLGNWPAPFGIILVADRLSTLMVLLSSVIGAASLIFSLARWHKVGPHFHSFMQFLLMGVNGAFLTGDLFNLFVFFEVMLTASYALALHGGGMAKVRAGMHYVVINLVASVCFLIGAAIIYGIAGTLNMADLAAKIANITEEDKIIFEAAVTMLGLAFVIKAGIWPLNFWLTPTYSAVAAPIGAIFTILSKVGIYVILRLTLLVLGSLSGELQGFGNDILLYGGMATLFFGFIGVLASQALGRLASYNVLVSSGTLLSAIGLGYASLTTGILYYMISSTLALAAFFMLVELILREQDTAAHVLAVTIEVYGEEEEEEENNVGGYIPATLALIGACFGLLSTLIIGMPPFSGFIAKFSLITNVFNPTGMDGDGSMLTVSDWVFIALLIISGFAALVAMTRSGSRSYWAAIEDKIPRVQIVEFFPIAGLLLLCLVLTFAARPLMHQLDETSAQLHQPNYYIDSVLKGHVAEDGGWRHEEN